MMIVCLQSLDLTMVWQEDACSMPTAKYRSSTDQHSRVRSSQKAMLCITLNTVVS
jgi:hypothetical protein